jgi:hypothetical protein
MYIDASLACRSSSQAIIPADLQSVTINRYIENHCILGNCIIHLKISFLRGSVMDRHSTQSHHLVSKLSPRNIPIIISPNAHILFGASSRIGKDQFFEYEGFKSTCNFSDSLNVIGVMR